MQHNKRLVLIFTLIMAAFLVASCGQAPAVSEKEQPAILEPIEGTELNRVILTEKAVERLGIETVGVTSTDGKLHVPYSAVIYDINGGTWVYIMTDTLTYQRASITVDSIENGEVTLTDGPAAGVEVVAVGVAELYGADTGVGK